MSPWLSPGLADTVSTADMPVQQRSAGLMHPLPYHILEMHSGTHCARPFPLYLPVGLSTCCRPLPRVIKAGPPVFTPRPLSTSKLSLTYKPHEVPGQ